MHALNVCANLPHNACAQCIRKPPTRYIRSMRALKNYSTKQHTPAPFLLGGHADAPGGVAGREVLLPGHHRASCGGAAHAAPCPRPCDQVPCGVHVRHCGPAAGAAAAHRRWGCYVLISVKAVKSDKSQILTPRQKLNGRLLAAGGAAAC
eukprot:131818-Pelagomonas_calceolata.AAC.2